VERELRGNEVDASGVTPDSGRTAACEGDFRRVATRATGPGPSAMLDESPVSSVYSPISSYSSVLADDPAAADDSDVTPRPEPGPETRPEASLEPGLRYGPDLYDDLARGLDSRDDTVRELRAGPGAESGREPAAESYPRPDPESLREPDAEAGPWRHRLRRLRAAVLRARARAYATPLGRIGVKITVAVLGTLVIAVGVVLLPLPGPGWVIILGGLALLAMEFQWAKRLLRFTREQLLRWTRLVREGSWLVRIVSVGGLLLVVGGALVLSLAMLA
jgi:uncharacterized protein (TIGR02611 family)